jgi:hypothetical protein
MKLKLKLKLRTLLPSLLLVAPLLLGCGSSNDAAVDDERIEDLFKSSKGKADANDLLCEAFGQPAGCPICYYLKHNQPFWYTRAVAHGVCSTAVDAGVPDVPYQYDVGVPDVPYHFDVSDDVTWQVDFVPWYMDGTIWVPDLGPVGDALWPRMDGWVWYTD